MADTSALQQRIDQLKAEYDSSQKQYSAMVKEVARLRKERSAAIAAGNYNPEDPVNKQRLQKISDLENEAIILLEDLKRTENQITSLESQLRTEQATSASTKENNAGTGNPGTAGEGPGASPAPEPSSTVISEEPSAEEPAGTQNEELGPPLVEPPVPDGETGSTPPEEPTGAPNEQSPPTPRGARGLQGSIARTRKQATAQDLYNYNAMKDWRVKLKLAPNATYLYKAKVPGILAPLAQTDGVIFPYTPQVQTNYIANYQAADLIHTNYKIYQYQNSQVDSVSITCDFTAQDTFEANYVLAVIHFFKSVTKMFYGKDQNPVNGTPPPLCYLDGYGQYQFNGHPLAITNFTYTLPNDVDYIRCTAFDAYSGDDNYQENTGTSQNSRAAASGIGPGGAPIPTKFNGLTPGGGVDPTYIPTRIQIQIQGIPIISRGDVSQNFSLQDYATGKLLQGNIRNGLGGGFW